MKMASSPVVANNIVVSISLAHQLSREDQPKFLGRHVTTKYEPFVVNLTPNSGPVGTRINKINKQCSICNATIEFEYRQEIVLFTTPSDSSVEGKKSQQKIISYLFFHGKLYRNIFKRLTAFSENPLLTMIFLLFFIPLVLGSILKLVLVIVAILKSNTDLINSNNSLVKLCIIWGIVGLLAVLLRVIYYYGYVKSMLTKKNALIRMDKASSHLLDSKSVFNIVSAIYSPIWFTGQHHLLNPLSRQFLHKFYDHNFGSFKYFD
jgi:hypothetical protein